MLPKGPLKTISSRGRRASWSLDRGALFLGLRRLGHVDRGGGWLARNVAEVLPHPGERVGGVEVADQRQHGVVRGVVGLEEVLHVLTEAALRSAIEPMTECL